MISNHLKLNGESLIAVMIPRATPEDSEALYRDITGKIITKLHHFLAQFLSNGLIVTKVHACKTIEELEQLDCEIVYPSMFADIATEVDAEPDLTDLERGFIFSAVADRMVKGAQDWFTNLARQRAQVIANPPVEKKSKNKIVDMNGKPAGESNRIIT